MTCGISSSQDVHSLHCDLVHQQCMYVLIHLGDGLQCIFDKMSDNGAYKNVYLQI